MAADFPGDPGGDSVEVVNDLLGLIGLSDEERAGWWTFARYADLGNRTPAQAWRSGDQDAVGKLVLRWLESARVIS